ncbi:hypothetical protein BC332_21422 [Capsicum chinense]|nr:hypothetical protein BC332_21422 [Capsicum chinense]
MNGVTVEKLDLVNTGGTILPMPKPGSNMTIKADVSVKNPNFASFRYSNTTTTISYHDTVVGEARGPSGKSKARGTTRINVTIDIITDKIVSHPGLQNDITTGLLTMNSYTRVGGRVKLLNMIKKHVIVKMNCSITVNITKTKGKEGDPVHSTIKAVIVEGFLRGFLACGREVEAGDVCLSMGYELLPEKFSRIEIITGINNAKKPSRVEGAYLNRSMDCLRGNGEASNGDVVLFPHDNNTTRATRNARLYELVKTQVIREVPMVHHPNFKEI